MLLDIHSHLIPNVDDGCRNINDSIKLIEESIKQGVTHIICTPHQIHHRYENNKDKIIEGFKNLKKEIKNRNLCINLYLGEEIHYHFPDLNERLKKGDLLTLNNSNVILLEFSYSHKPNDPLEIIYNLNCDGYKVIVAHVERYKWINVDYLKKIRETGNYIQVNADALIGKHGFANYLFANKIKKLGLIDYIASDMHYFRPSNIAKSLKKFKNKGNINKNIFKI